jgi:hypothetical protein
MATFAWDFVNLAGLDNTSGKDEGSHLASHDPENEFKVVVEAKDDVTGQIINLDNFTFQIVGEGPPEVITTISNSGWTGILSMQGDLSGLFQPQLLEYRDGLDPVASAPSWDSIPADAALTHFIAHPDGVKSFVLSMTAEADGDTEVRDLTLYVARNFDVDIPMLKGAA